MLLEISAAVAMSILHEKFNLFLVLILESTRTTVAQQGKLHDAILDISYGQGRRKGGGGQGGYSPPIFQRRGLSPPPQYLLVLEIALPMSLKYLLNIAG